MSARLAFLSRRSRSGPGGSWFAFSRTSAAKAVTRSFSDSVGVSRRRVAMSLSPAELTKSAIQTPKKGNLFQLRPAADQALPRDRRFTRPRRKAVEALQKPHNLGCRPFAFAASCSVMGAAVNRRHRKEPGALMRAGQSLRHPTTVEPAIRRAEKEPQWPFVAKPATQCVGRSGVPNWWGRANDGGRLGRKGDLEPGRSRPAPAISRAGAARCGAAKK